MLRCVVHDRAVYLSTPITTGPRFLKWVASGRQGGTRGNREYVIEPNIGDGRRLATKVRRTFPLVIDPTELGPISGWQQDRYHGLWTSVVCDLSSLLVFNRGWEYSNGCALEYRVAREHHLATLDHEMRVIQSEDARRRLGRAIRRLQKEDLPTEILENVLAAT